MDFLIVVKMITASIILVVSTVLAERLSPKYGGFVMSFPVSSAIIVFFMSWEHGIRFAMHASSYIIAGIIPLILFHITYVLSVRHLTICNHLFASLVLFGGMLSIYMALALALSFCSLSLALASFVFAVAFYLFFLVSRQFPTVKINNPKALKTRILLARASVGAMLIVTIIELSKFLGPRLGGALAAFPTTTLPTMWILHRNYGTEAVLSTQRGAFYGLPCIVAYFWLVYYLYPRFGIGWGTLGAYLGTSCFLWAWMKLFGSGL